MRGNEQRVAALASGAPPRVTSADAQDARDRDGSVSEVIRNLGQEVVVSQSIDLYKNLLIIISAAAIALTVVVDLLDRRDNIYYLRSMLAAIVAGGLIVSMLRYTRNFVDEVRAGPDYLVVHRESRSVVIPIDQIEHVWLNHFTVLRFGVFVRLAKFLPRIEVRLVRPSILGSTIAFYPRDAWRTRWTRGPMQNMLRAADDPMF
jgi:hypothetical protein